MNEGAASLLFPGYESMLLVNHGPFRKWWGERPDLPFGRAADLWHMEEEQKRKRCPHCGK